MSFLIDPPWLYENGRAIGAVETDDRSCLLYTSDAADE